MKIELKNGRMALAKDIAALEAGLGCKLSPDFLRFVGTNDGAAPEPNSFKIGRSDEAEVAEFIPVAKILEERADIGVFPKKAFPIAHDGLGDYVCIDEDRDGEVFFWDHDTDKRHKLAKSFDAFLKMLKPFDMNLLPPMKAEVEILDPEAFKVLVRSDPRHDDGKP